MIPATGPVNWNTTSFIYLNNSDLGFNQSHLYQHLKSSVERIKSDSSSRRWQYGEIMQNLFLRLGTWVTSTNQEAGLGVAVNFNDYIRNACAFSSVVYNVFDPVTFKPMVNKNSGSEALYGSASICSPSRTWNFEYRYTDSLNRRKARDFMQNVVPDGAYVVVRSFLLDPKTFPQHPQAYAEDWKADAAVYGQGNTFYDHLKNAGLTTIDSFNRPRQFALVYKKNDPSFQPKYIFLDNTTENRSMSVDVMTKDTLGFITSPKFGPAKEWKELRWRGNALDNAPGDNPQVSVIGIKNDGTTDVLISGLTLAQQTVSLASINTTQYPYLQLHMRNVDSVSYTPYQLKHWRVTYVPFPEGAVAPTVSLKKKDTLDVAEPLNFELAFKNVSDVRFDSLLVKMTLTDRNNTKTTLPSFRVKPLNGSEVVNIQLPVDTRLLVGNNQLYIEVNPDNDQPELFKFNNFLYANFYVRGDTMNPVLDVTFDNVHILNHDIVSSKPNILIKLKDEAKWFLLNDPSKVNVQVRFPNGNLRTYNFNSDTLKFIPASGAPNSDNTATVNFTPAFLEDGQYELIVSGKDMSNNAAGAMQYRVLFNVINKAMISNMLNYPNPFTTSTAFVFTITGNQVPQNLKIQILTVTGKVVREITKNELGPLHVGRNITEFKWDGTDQYGQKLGNGVYLYRVVTNLNGKSLEKYKSDDDDTEKYFNKGYGKMYLMR